MERMGLCELHLGDVLERLQELPSESVHTTVTSPPYYSLRDYGVEGQIGSEKSPEEYIARMVQVFAELRRVLRKDGTLWLNMGDGLEKKNLLGMPWRVALALQADGWHLRSDIIWCLSGGTRVYARTQKGEMPMTIKDLARLDPKTVKLWNGEKWTQLLGVSMSGRQDDEIEFTLRSGERINCTPTHKWPTKRGLIEAKDIAPGDVILSTKLPEPENPVSPSCLPDDLGWFVGIYLAEGSRDSTGTIQIASHAKEEERFRRLDQIAFKFGARCRVHKLDGNSAVACIDSAVLSAVIDTYLSGRTAGDKRLSNRCWQRSDRFLTSLMEGYLDGDGHYDRSNDRWRLGFTRNYGLEADLRTLCGRLDLPLTLNLATATIGEVEYKTFRGEVRFSRGTHPNCKDRGEVVAVGKSKGRQFYDLGVEDEPHLFALASGILTHNSKPNPMPESVRDRPTKSHEYVFLLSRSPRYFYDPLAVREAITGNAHSRGNGVHKKAKSANRHKIKQHPGFSAAIKDLVADRNIRSVWKIATRGYKGAHFACFPPALPERCIRAGTSAHGVCPRCGSPWLRVVERERKPTRPGKDSKVYVPDPTKKQDALGDPRLVGFNERWRESQEVGNRDPQRHCTVTTTAGWKQGCKCEPAIPVPATVLEPFLGSGTTLAVAALLGRRGIGIELNPEYMELARQRLRESLGMFALAPQEV